LKAKTKTKIKTTTEKMERGNLLNISVGKCDGKSKKRGALQMKIKLFERQLSLLIRNIHHCDDHDGCSCVADDNDDDEVPGKDVFPI